MNARLCPLCGLETDRIEDHATSTHGTSLDDAKALLEDGRRDLAAKLERTAAQSGTKTITLDDARQAAGMREGGYL